MTRVPDGTIGVTWNSAASAAALSGCVGEELPHGDPRRSGAGELLDVARRRRVEVQPAALHQQHRRGRGHHHLGQRGEIVERALGRHGARGGRPREPPVALGEEDRVAAPHDERRPGVGTGADAAQDDRIERGGVKPECASPGAKPRGERDSDLQQNDR